MQQIKIFTGLEQDREAFEQEINQWLVDVKPNIVKVFGNIAPQTPGKADSIMAGSRVYGPSDIFIVFLYEAAQSS